MNREEILDRLRAKLTRNIDDFQRTWRSYTPSTIIAMSKTIYATQIAFNELCRDKHPDDVLENLLRFENPLEVVRDQWINEHFTQDMSRAMGDALLTIKEHHDAEKEYKLDESYSPPEMAQTFMPV